MSMLAVMQYLSEREGISFTTAQLAEALGYGPSSMSTIIGKIKRDWLYSRYLITELGPRSPEGYRLASHRVRPGTKKELFEERPH